MSAMLPVMLWVAGLPAAAEPLPNLDFAAQDLRYWQGSGFRLEPQGVSSRDAKGQALLYRTFIVPGDAAAIRFSAAAVRPDGTRPGPILDIYLEAAERRLVPKQVRDGNSWRPARLLLPFFENALREYQWDLAGHVGQQLRIVLLDQDDRPGCYVSCGGFRLVRRDGAAIKEFEEFMLGLARDQQLSPFARFDSKHFTALSNGDDEYVEHRLYNCETIYSLFYPHFREKGFTVHEPISKLMVAIFDTQAGFEAYLGQKMSSAITGIYHTPTNRLVVYDYASNRAFVASKKQSEGEAQRISNELARRRYVGSFNRQFADFRNDLNIGTIMHEVAHQLSFNGGLLNRAGDAPVWVVEGLATYCESTSHGSWAGIGEPNPNRCTTLANVLKNGGKFIPLRDLVSSDDWLRKSQDVNRAVQGYAQCWALFRLLMEERPDDLKRYLELIYPRRTAEHRLADFVECFGVNLDRFEQHYVSYLRKAAAEAKASP